MDRVAAALARFLRTEIDELERINCHHNFTEAETHFGERVWVSRKGAIMADEGRPGLIPGSMGTASYVVEGLGNPLSLDSAPHGAGRRLSRNAARRRPARAGRRAAAACARRSCRSRCRRPRRRA